MNIGIRLLTLLGFGCVGPTAEPLDSGRSAPAPLVLDGAQWILDWNTDDVELHDEGWTLTTDRGFEVEIETGWVVNYSVTLVPCASAQQLPTPAWLHLIAGQSAWADHTPYDDPSRIELAQAEDLTSPSSISLQHQTFPLSTYCGMHWLVARGDPETEIAGTSLRLQGHWAHGDAEGPIDIDTAFANALDRDLPSVTGSDHEIIVRVTRQLASLFDGIDLQTDTDDAIAWAILSNLTDHAQVSLTTP